MKKNFLQSLSRHFLVCSFFVFLNSNVNAQTFNGNLTLNSQGAVDAFNYTSVTGILTIGNLDFPSGDITNLNSLSMLTSVGGGLDIKGNTALTNLNGLSNLVSIGNGLSIVGNTSLTSISGLSKLSSIGGGLSIANNSSLTNLNGLSKITSLSTLYIGKNLIGNIDSLSNLTSISESLEISSNDGLANINGLANLRFVGNTVKVFSNPNLTNTCGLFTLFSNQTIEGSKITFWGNATNPQTDCHTLTGNLKLTTQAQIDAINYTSITGNLTIEEAFSGDITNLGGLSNLTSLGGSLTIRNNTALTSYCGLYSLFNSGYSGNYAVSGNAANPTSSQIVTAGVCSVYTGDIFLSSQAQVDAFNYSGVTGTLTIEESASGNITNLNALSQLTFIGKDLIFFGNTALTNLNWLSHLTTIGGNLEIGESHLTNVDGLSGLNSMMNLFLSFNNSLVNLDGLSHVSSLPGVIDINTNNALTSVIGLSHVTNISELQIDNNTALTSLDGLNHIQTIVSGSIGGITIRRNTVLTDLDGLAGVTSVTGQVEISQNNALTNINGLANLTNIQGDLIIFQNPVLQNINGLANLRSFYQGHEVSNILISDNAVLANVNGLSSLQSLSGGLTITDNLSLENIDGLYHLNLAVFISIQRNNSLTNLNGFSNLFSLNNLQVKSNTALTDFCGLYHLLTQSSVTTTDISGNAVNPTSAQIISGGACSNIQPDFTLTSQAEVDAFNYTFVPANLVIHEDIAGDIKNLNALSQLTGIAGGLDISNNAALTNFDGLSHLTSVGADFFIDQNNSLTNVSGLSHLTEIGKSLQFVNNPSLTTISGLSNLSFVKDIEINSNNVLTNLDGLAGLSAVESITIANNNALTSLNGLSKLASVENVLGIRNNIALTNVDGLSGLNFIGAIANSTFPAFDLRSNTSLTNLDGLSHLHTLQGNLLISSNTTLSKFCGLYDLLSSGGLGGTYRVISNAANPTQQEIIDGGACESSVNPGVTINQASGQADPTSVLPIHFTVNFSEAVTGFDASDISFTGSTTTGTLIATITGGTSVYDVSVSGMTSNGTVVVSIPAAAAMNVSSLSSLASTSTDNIVNFILNNCPQASALNLSTSVGSVINFQLPGSDANSDPLTYSVSQMPVHGLLSISSTGVGNYIPATAYTGTDLFKYQISDGKCDAEATVNITIVVCPAGQGYWKNNKNLWPVNSLLLGTRTYTKEQLITILTAPVGSGKNADASLILADQLIAAKLDIANGSPASSALNDSIAAADVLIGANLLPMKVKPNSAQGKKMTAFAAYFSNYNGGAMTNGCTLTQPLTFMMKQEEQKVSEGFALEQNRPNPFNQTTMISYQLPIVSHVKLKVYNAFGQQIITVIDEMQSAGTKTVRLNGLNLAAGVYYYQLTAGNFSEVKKMIVVK